MGRFTVDEYHRMIELGFFNHETRTELIEGEVIIVSRRSIDHDRSIELIAEEVLPVLPTGWRRRIKSGITTDDNELETDIAIVRAPPDRYCDSHPRGADIGALIEVADDTLAFDRVTKGRVYARANCQVYWVVNLIDRQVEVYTDPDRKAVEPLYATRRDYAENESVPLVIGAQQVAMNPVQSLLPS